MIALIGANMMMTTYEIIRPVKLLDTWNAYKLFESL